MSRPTRPTTQRQRSLNISVPAQVYGTSAKTVHDAVAARVSMTLNSKRGGGAVNRLMCFPDFWVSFSFVSVCEWFKKKF